MVGHEPFLKCRSKVDYTNVKRSPNKTSNYHQYLPELQSDLTNDILKDPYNFDFLTIQGKAHERSIENALITHIRDFLIELGQGFAFVGSQVPLTFDDQYESLEITKQFESCYASRRIKSLQNMRCETLALP